MQSVFLLATEISYTYISLVKKMAIYALSAKVILLIQHFSKYLAPYQ